MSLKDTPTAELIRELELRSYKVELDGLNAREQNARDNLLVGLVSIVGLIAIEMGVRDDEVSDTISRSLLDLLACKKERCK